ncbi:hypothetical protein QBC36DRAFT_316596, partial [Triangularia setosa]
TLVAEWTQQWERIFHLALRYKSSDVMDPATWLGSLLTVARGNPLLGYWASNFRMNKKSQVLSGQMTFREVAKDIRDDMIYVNNEVKRSTKAAFPIFKGEETEGEDPMRGGRSSHRGARGRGSHYKDESTKRKRVDSGAASGPVSKKNTTCKACHGAGHELRNCFYVFPEKVPRQSHFRLNISVKWLVQAMQSADPKLSEEIETVRREERNNKNE